MKKLNLFLVLCAIVAVISGCAKSDTIGPTSNRDYNIDLRYNSGFLNLEAPITASSDSEATQETDNDPATNLRGSASVGLNGGQATLAQEGASLILDGLKAIYSAYGMEDKLPNVKLPDLINPPKPSDDDDTPTITPQPVPEIPSPEYREDLILDDVSNSDKYTGEMYVYFAEPSNVKLVRIGGVAARKRIENGKSLYYVNGTVESNQGKLVQVWTLTNYYYSEPLPKINDITGNKLFAYAYVGPTNGKRPTWRIKGHLSNGQPFKFKCGPTEASGVAGPRKGGIGWEQGGNVVKNAEHRHNEMAILIHSRYAEEDFASTDCWITLQ